MLRKTRKTAGLIGLGIIGSHVAAGLRAAGFQTYVWNRSPRPAPNFLASPAEVAEVCDVIQLFVADAQALFDVIDAFGERLTENHVVICSATVGLEATLEAARMVQERGAHFLDAPFTGSKGAAEKRQLVYYVGGDEPTFIRARPLLEATSKAIVRIGKIGDAAIIKVVTNMIAAVSIQTLSEALAIVCKSGLSPGTLKEALEHNACRSGTMDLKLPKMISGDYEPHFSLKHMFKDVQLGIHLANELGLEIPATTVTAGVLYGAMNHGWPEEDFSAIFKVYEQQLKSAAQAGREEMEFEVEENWAAPELPAPEQPAVQTAPPSAPEPVAAETPAAPPSVNEPVETRQADGGESHGAFASSEALEFVPTVPHNAKVAGDSGPETREESAADTGKSPSDENPPAGNRKPFNRIRRFFSAARP